MGKSEHETHEDRLINAKNIHTVSAMLFFSALVCMSAFMPPLLYVVRAPALPGYLCLKKRVPGHGHG